jgi:methylated-DNA-[protein]-cysteine S-methyltransferase
MMTTHELSQCFVQAPGGRLQLVATDDSLIGVYFQEHRHMRTFEAREVAAHPVLEVAKRELSEYFAGERARFDTPLAPHASRGGTAFQAEVWDALLAIPFGETWTYGELARFIGRPAAVRAVGAANGLNPLSIFVPCHRVVGASGSLTGYAGGLVWKRWLLEHEQSRRRPSSASCVSGPLQNARLPKEPGVRR